MSSTLFSLYNLKHLRDRKVSVWLTVAGFALVVSVFIASQMLEAGLKRTLSGTGSAENVMVVRNGAQNEIQSGLPRDNVSLVLADEAVARNPDGSPMGSGEIVVIISLDKRADGEKSNVTVRGVSAASRAIRDQVHIVTGRWPAPGTQEIVVGSAVNHKFTSTDLNGSIRMVGIEWPIVGIFDAGDASFSSEVWGDVDVMAGAFRRDKLSTVIFKQNPSANFEQIKTRLEEDRRLSVSVKNERAFFGDQARALSLFITLLGAIITILFSLGAIVGGAITMYANVANRVREIGILRTLGFSRRSIFTAFVSESVVLALAGGLLGVLLASLLSWGTISTMNFQTFADVRFGFALTPKAVINAFIFCVIMGVVSGILPGWRACRMSVREAVRE